MASPMQIIFSTFVSVQKIITLEKEREFSINMHSCSDRVQVTLEVFLHVIELTYITVM